MNNDLKALDFDAVTRLLEKLARTPYGADAARHLEPAPERVVALQMQTAVTAARSAIDAGQPPPLNDVPQIQAALRQSATPGATLRPLALHHIAQVIAAAKALVPYLDDHKGLYPGPTDDLDPVEPLNALLIASLDAAGRLRHDASPNLAELNAEYRRCHESARQIVLQCLQKTDMGDDANVADRVHWQGDRAVAAIPPAEVAGIKGVRHGGYAGHELIEPLEVVAANNRTDAVAGRISAEQQRILRAITDNVRASLEGLNRVIAAITWIDLAFCGGELSARMGGHAPRLVETPGVVLQQAYHPLLLLQFVEGSLERPVPLSLNLDGEQRILLITGPNTGGKTVALKTLGLLTAMAHSGLHIPADDDCTFGWYREIMVDVGDRQSLYHHLSTFAGHVEVLKRILSRADASTLVLLDELGTGTDPEEGAALAMAVLDELAERGVQGVVNTHLAPLKDFATSKPWLRNASMCFDAETLRPTYQLKLGQAGTSFGLIIAQQNGLPATLIDRARAHLARLTASAA